MSPGTLWVVATPLGNLEDLSPRAARILRESACIACEDTRRTAKLRARLDIDTPTVSCHRFNEKGRIEPLLDRLRAGEDVALVSDGGTPGISDPGAALVAAALEAGLPVAPVPGPSAAAALLSACGLVADRFVFEGFLPHRGGERRRRLRELVGETRPVVFFESPLRLRATLADLAAIFGERTIVLGREMTKVHEALLRGNASELLKGLRGADARGECTLVIAGAGTSDPFSGGPDAQETGRLRESWSAAIKSAAGDRKLALREVSRQTGLKRAVLWRRLQELGLVGRDP